MTNRLCDYGNCHTSGESSDMVVVSGGGFRKHFCSWLHAALWCCVRQWNIDAAIPSLACAPMADRIEAEIKRNLVAEVPR